MATQLENDKYVMFFKKRGELLLEGYHKGLVKFFTEDGKNLEKLRTTYYGGIPLSIILLCLNMSNHKCYDKAFLVTYLFRDNPTVRQVDADIDSITLNPANIDVYRNFYGYLPEHYGNHSFVEVEENGITWVWDTTSGLIIEKNLYYEIEHPIITSIIPKQAIELNPDYEDLITQVQEDLEHDFDNSPFLVPKIEEIIRLEKEHHSIYSSILDNELKIFKKSINYKKRYKQYYKKYRTWLRGEI